MLPCVQTWIKLSNVVQLVAFVTGGMGLATSEQHVSVFVFLKDRFLQVPALYDYMTLGNL